MLEEHGYDAPEHLEVVETAGVGAGVVGEEQPEEEKDEVLQREG